MTSRQTVSALLAALVLVGMTAGAANAAARHHVHRMHAMTHARSGHVRAMTAASRGTRPQDTMADRLNAQSLQRVQAGDAQMPAQPAMGAAPGAAQ